MNRLVFRDLQLAETGARAAGIEAYVVGDLHQCTGEGHRRAGIDQLVVRGQGGELVGRGEERSQAGLGGDPRRRLLPGTGRQH